MKIDSLKRLIEETTVNYIEDQLPINKYTPEEISKIVKTIIFIILSSQTEEEVYTHLTKLKTTYPALSQKLTKEIDKYKQYD